MPDSPAFDAGTNGPIAGVDFDPRGQQFQRFIGVRVDVGAFEGQPAGPLRITSLQALQTGSAKVQFTGSDGVPYRIEWSPDVGTWEDLGAAIVIGPAQFEYLDTETTQQPRFYRVKAP